MVKSLNLSHLTCVYSLLPPPHDVPQPGVGGGTLVTRLQPLPGAEVGARQPAVVRLLKINKLKHYTVCNTARRRPDCSVDLLTGQVGGVSRAVQRADQGGKVTTREAGVGLCIQASTCAVSK